MLQPTLTVGLTLKERGVFYIIKISTDLQLADMLTKCMDPTPFYNQMALHGMTNSCQNSI